LYDNDDTISPGVGRSFFEVENESLPNTQDLIQLDFGASNEVEVGGFTIGDFNVYSDTERVNEINDRILYIYDNDSPAVFSLARFFPLGWDQLKENNYKNWLESFRNIRGVEGLASLKKSDVLGFDFMKLVYIDYFKSSFFVLKIENYVKGRLTKIKLLKFL
jgi:hypothetical protein